MSTLYKKTVWYRATVDQQAATIVPAEENAPPNSYRCVQIVVPDSPLVAVAIDQFPEDIAFSRSYEWPMPPTGRSFEFRLLPEQTVQSVARTSLAQVSVIVEYHQEKP